MKQIKNCKKSIMYSSPTRITFTFSIDGINIKVWMLNINYAIVLSISIITYGTKNVFNTGSSKQSP
jgi:hypothetical protein